MIPYKTFTLCENKKYQIDCIKYDEKYQKYLKEIAKLNSELASYIKTSPIKSTGVESYIIMCNNVQCLGGINLNITNKKLNIYLDLIDNKFKNEESLASFIGTIINSIAVNYKEISTIAVYTTNKVDLSQYFSKAFERKIIQDKYYVYICHNKNKKNTIKNILTKKR